METFWESVGLMAFVYVLAAAVSLAVAGIIKLIFAGVQMRKARAEAPPEAGDAAGGKAD